MRVRLMVLLPAMLAAGCATDPDKDPVFAQGIRSQNGFTFLSFLGEVHEVDFSGPEPLFAPTWSMVSGSEHGHWRPGADPIDLSGRAPAHHRY